MPIQMIGTRRSGSNLLRVMIGQLDGVYTPQSTHMLEYFYPLIPFYGDLDDDEIFLSLVDDVCKCVEYNPVTWDGVTLDKHEVAAICKTRSLLSIFEAIYSIAARQSGCTKDWMCKCLGHINYFDKFEEYFSDDMRYIYIYRDGRDVALSFTKAFAGQKHHYFIAKEWLETQEKAIALQQKLPKERFHAVCYESLLREPEKICRSIAEFVGQEYTKDMLNFYNSKAAKNSANSSKLWSNITKPIIEDNSKKFFSQSSLDDVLIFESVAGEMLKKLGYPCYLSDHKKVFDDRLLKEYEYENTKRKEKIIEQANVDDINRREKQKQYVDSVKRRLDCSDVSYDGNMMHKSSVSAVTAA